MCGRLGLLFGLRFRLGRKPRCLSLCGRLGLLFGRRFLLVCERFLLLGCKPFSFSSLGRCCCRYFCCCCRFCCGCLFRKHFRREPCLHRMLTSRHAANESLGCSLHKDSQTAGPKLEAHMITLVRCRAGLPAGGGNRMRMGRGCVRARPHGRRRPTRPMDADDYFTEECATHEEEACRRALREHYPRAAAGADVCVFNARA